ncbi:hypothetical protein OSB04_019789, partial [Centaurea solstitialis]
MDDSEDRISTLPDEIVHHIVSFLDMKYAVQTSALSKKWKHIWTSMKHLNLNSGSFDTSDKFVKFVNDVLSHRNYGIEVPAVELSFEGGTLHFDEVVKSVVNYAYPRNVRKLTIEWFWNGEVRKLPRRLFRCHTLKHLTLAANDDTAAYGVSVSNSAWDFPALETMYLTNIEFRDHKSSLNLFSKCVNLKDLTLHRCYMLHVDIFDVCAPQLSNLTIIDPFRFPKVFNMVAPKLKSLTASVMDMCSNFLHLSVEDLDSLEKVNLFMGPHSCIEKRYAPGLLDLFQKLCNAKFLILDDGIIKHLSTCRDQLLREPCPFNNLMYVKIEKQKNRTTTMPTHIKNYFLESSPRVSFIKDLPKVPSVVSRPTIRGPRASKRSNTSESVTPTTESSDAHASFNLEDEDDAEDDGDRPRPMDRNAAMRGGSTATAGGSNESVTTLLSELNTLNSQREAMIDLKRKELEIRKRISLAREAKHKQKDFEFYVSPHGHLRGEKMDDRESMIDRISNLPNEIIHHILSFLDLKYAIQTSTLSKRWKHIWTSMPHLNLNCRSFRTSPNFLKFVNDVLSHRNHGIEVSAVELSFEGRILHCYEVLKSVVNYAYSRNVRKLTIEWYSQETQVLQLPQHFFSCHTLKHLTLATNNLHAFGLNIPKSTWDFPALETLNLSNVSIGGAVDRRSLNLFSKCVNLKDLILHQCSMFYVEFFNVCAPQLCNLTITDPYHFPKVINVVAPKLESLTASVLDICSNFLPLSAEGLDSLEKVNLSVQPRLCKEKRDASGLLDLFQKLCNAKFLILNDGIIKVPRKISGKQLDKGTVAKKVPQKRSREEVDEGTMAKKVSNVIKAQQKKSREEVPLNRSGQEAVNGTMASTLDKEKQQTKTMEEENRMLEAKIVMQDEVIAEKKSKLQAMKMLQTESKIQTETTKKHGASIIVEQMDDRASIIVEEDRISTLSDEIIRHILSFLDMKYVVQTSALSKRWKDIWTSMKHLNLNSRSSHASHKFVKFVNDALSHRNHGIEVSAVELSFGEGTLHFDEVVASVVNYAYSRNVRKLTIEWFWNREVRKLPGCLFSCHTLKHLTLTTNDDTAAFGLSLPNSAWDFPALETLNLTNIEFRDYKSSLNLFSKCVNLKNLTLRHCSMYRFDIFDVCAPQLSTLTIIDPFRFPKVFNMVAPKLKSLTASVMDMCSNFLQLSVEDLDSLEKVNLFMGPHSCIEKRYVPALRDLFHKLCSAKFLILDVGIIKCLSTCWDQLLREPCPFNNLNYVKIEKQKNRTKTVPTHIKNYFLKSSPRVTFIKDLYKVPHKISRKDVDKGTMAKKVSNVINVRQKRSREEVDKGTMPEKALSSCTDQPSHEPSPINNVKCLNQTDLIPIRPVEFRNQLPESSPSATFNMDLPQVDKGAVAKKVIVLKVPCKRSKKQVPHKRSGLEANNDTMANTLDKEIQQTNTVDEEKRTLEEIISMQDELIAEQKMTLEAMKVQHEKKMLEAKIDMQDEIIAQQKEATKLLHENRILKEKLRMQDKLIAKQKGMLETMKLQNENKMFEAKIQRQDKIIAEQKAMMEAMKLQHEKIEMEL